MAAMVTDAKFDTHAHDKDEACCGACRHANAPPRVVVIGVFMDLEGAENIAKRLRVQARQSVNVLSGIDGYGGEPPLRACSPMYQLIKRHLTRGAAVVVVDADGPEQQLGISRLLLESKCEVLMTHDGRRHGD